MEKKEKELKFIERISETEHYGLWVADVPGVDLTCYAIVNKKWGVVEMSTSLLANAKKFLEMLTRWEINPPRDEDSPGMLPDFPSDPSMYS